MKPVRSHWLAFVTGALAFSILMTTLAIVAWQDFSWQKVLLAEGAMALGAIAIFFVGNLKLKFPKLSLLSSIRQTATGLAFAIFALLLSFSPARAYHSFYQPFALQNLDAGVDFHQDTAFHSTLIQSILNFGFPSTGQHGAPLTFYYTLSHYIDAFACWVGGLNPYLSAGLLFHFKKLILILLISLFLAQITKGKSALFRSISLLLLLPAFIGTWTIIGSEGLWSTTAVILVSMPRIYAILKTANPTTKQYLYLSLVLFLTGFGKFSSSLMLALFAVLMLIHAQRKSRKFWLFSFNWLGMYAVMAYLFTLSHTTAPIGTSLSNMLNFLSIIHSEHAAKSLIAIYALLALFAILNLRFRTSLFKRFTIAIFVMFVALALLSSHFGKSDILYFTFALLFTTLIFGVPLLLEHLEINRQDKSTWMLAALLAVTTAVIPQTTLHVLGSTPKDVKTAIHTVNQGFFATVEEQTGSRVSILGLLRGAKLPHPKPGRLQTFLTSLTQFTEREKLNAQNSVLYIPKKIFENETKFISGPYWAKGLLFYSLTGIPLVHGSPELWLGYGFGNYKQADTWTNSPADLQEFCGMQKTVITVTDFTHPTFNKDSCAKVN